MCARRGPTAASLWHPKSIASLPSLSWGKDGPLAPHPGPSTPVSSPALTPGGKASPSPQQSHSALGGTSPAPIPCITPSPMPRGNRCPRASPISPKRSSSASRRVRDTPAISSAVMKVPTRARATRTPRSSGVRGKGDCDEQNSNQSSVGTQQWDRRGDGGGVGAGEGGKEKEAVPSLLPPAPSQWDGKEQDQAGRSGGGEWKLKDLVG